MIVGNSASDRLASGGKLELCLTVDGLANLIMDLRKQGRKPTVIVVSEKERRDLNDQLKAHSIAPIKKDEVSGRDDVNDNFSEVAFVLGVPIMSNPEVEHGKARILFAPPAA